MGLGTPDQVTLAEARSARDDARALILRGSDPIDERQRREIAETRSIAPSFGEFADAHIARHRASWRNPKHADQWEMTLREYAKPIRKKALAEITTADVLAILEPIWQSKAETAGRLRGRIESILDAARAHGYIPDNAANPARWKGHLSHLLARRSRHARSHFPAMPWRDVPAFVATLRAEESISARALEFTVLTAARSGETRLATPAEFDLDAGIWIIPGDRMKAGKTHAVPLPPRAVEIVREVREAFPRSIYVFPSVRKPRTPLSDMTMSMFLRRRGLPYVAHGFRSSFRDWIWEATNFPRELAEAALAHIINNLTEAAYRRGGALDRRRELMTAWQAFLDGEQVALLDAHHLPIAK